MNTFIYYPLAIILIFLFLEILFRLLGHKPYRVEERTDIVIEPEGRFTTKHPVLGYAHLPGRFKVTLSRASDSFTATHLDNALRITRPLGTYNVGNRKKEMWVFGCSFTYGWLVNDEETYPWHLQERFQDYEVVNFARIGYGTIHAYLQLKEALRERGRPDVVILGYGSFHDERNIFSRARRKTLVTWSRLGPLVQPYARLDKKGALRWNMADVLYREWPLMRQSAFIHYLETRYNRIEERLQNSRRIAEAVIREIYQLCIENGTVFVIAGITRDSRTSEMLEYCRGEGISAVDISPEPGDTAARHPCGSHPSQAGQRGYAQRLAAFLDTTLSRQPLNLK